MSHAEPIAAQEETREITAMSAGQLAAHIADGDLSAFEAIEAHIERIEKVNPHLNAVVVKRYEAARAEAVEADRKRRAGAPLGKLHGVPVTIKESLDLAGTTATFGLTSRAGQRAAKDEGHVARLRREGGIVLGKTNVAQLLFYYESDNPVYGRSNNPWNPARTPGGSSGGEAAIIAAGGSPLGLGTDIGGSVRIPAGFSGVAGLKPTAGRTPDPGRFSVPVGQQAIASQVGVLARHVEDVALGLEVINGGAPDRPAAPLGDFREVYVNRLRVAYYTDDGTLATAPAVKRAIREAADILRGRGAQVTAWTPPDAGLGVYLLYGIFGADGGKLMSRMLGKDERTPHIKQLLSILSLPRPVIRAAIGLLGRVGQPTLAAGLQAFGYKDTAHYWQLVEMLMDYRDRFAAALDSDAGGPFDVILSPISPLPAFTHGASRDLLTAGAYAPLYNVLGYPAGVVPVTRVREDEQVGRQPTRDRVEQVALSVEQLSAGLPVGVQVAARPWREDVALAVMAAIQAVARTRPDYPRTPVAVG
jgi:fatty acid amide hydrolase